MIWDAFTPDIQPTIHIPTPMKHDPVLAWDSHLAWIDDTWFINCEWAQTAQELEGFCYWLYCHLPAYNSPKRHIEYEINYYYEILPLNETQNPNYSAILIFGKRRTSISGPFYQMKKEDVIKFVKFLYVSLNRGI